MRSDLSPLNEWWSAVPSLGERRSQISALVKEKTGRKMQAKAEPLREGVVVIKEDTTMEELQELGRRFQEKFGVTPVQIAIHKDEGHWHGEVWKPNLHAHIVFDWYDHSTGKSIKTTSLDAIEMQTICAEVLGMERGVSSEKKHLEAARYKAQARQKELDVLEQKAGELQEELNELSSTKTAKEESISTIRELGSKARSLISGKDRREKKKLSEIAALNAAEAKKNAETAQMEHSKRIVAESALKTTSEELKAARNENLRLREDVTTAVRRADALQLGLDKLKRNLPDVLHQISVIGLGINDAITLASGNEVYLNSITYEGKKLTMGDGSPIRLRWDKHIIAKLAASWYTLKEWCREALHSPWCAVDGITNNRTPNKGMRL